MDESRTFFTLLVVFFGVVAGLILLPLVRWMLAAALLAFLLYPVHRRLVPSVGPFVSALLLTGFAVVATIIPLLVISAVVLQTLRGFARNFDPEETAQRIDEFLDQYLGVELDLESELEDILSRVTEGFGEPLVDLAVQQALTIFDITIRVGLGLLVLIFLVFYFIRDGPRLLAWIRDLAPLEDDVLKEFFQETHVITWAVLKTHVLVAIVEGILGGIALYLLGVPNALFWTFVMILVSILPVIGVWLVWGPAVGYLFVVDATLQAFILLLYGMTVLAVIDNYLRAILVDMESGLHPAVVLVGVIGGIYLIGIIGLFLGPILLAVFKASVTVYARTYSPPAETAEGPS